MLKTKVRTCDMIRHLPDWAKVVKVINGIPIYNMNIFDNIMSWNQENLDVPAFDYYGNIITYRELPEIVNEYVCGLRSIDITNDDVVTLCLPVSIENMVMLFALNCIGAIANNVNYLFLKSDFEHYTRDKKSDTLVILDAYLPDIVDYLESSSIKNVIVTSLTDYLPDNNKRVFDDLSKLPKKLREIFDNPVKKEKCLKVIPSLESIRFIKMTDLIKLGKHNLVPLVRNPVDIERDISYSYTSGTTGTPKCIVYKELSANALIELHIGVNTKDYVGERVFQVIPLTHATGERFCGYLQMARGKTMVPQPIYNKETFGLDVMKSKCNWITAAPSFYLAGIAQGFIAKDAFSLVTRPSSGGEPVTKSNVALIDNWLKMNGCKVRFSIGGGAAEDGSSTICSYFMDEETKTNETGHPVEPGIRARIVDENGIELKQGQRGFLHVSSPAAADRYLNDPIASEKRWFYDGDGVRWGITGDIAIQNPDGSYNILGRASDSYIDDNGNTVYLFDIEYSLDVNDPVIEWEITAHKVGKGYCVVGQVVLKNDCKLMNSEVIELLSNKYKLDSIKIYEKFENSDVTGKRDFKLLKNDKVGYYAPCDESSLFQVSYADNEISRVKIEKSTIDRITFIKGNSGEITNRLKT